MKKIVIVLMFILTAGISQATFANEGLVCRLKAEVGGVGFGFFAVAGFGFKGKATVSCKTSSGEPAIEIERNDLVLSLGGFGPGFLAFVSGIKIEAAGIETDSIDALFGDYDMSDDVFFTAERTEATVSGDGVEFNISIDGTTASGIKLYKYNYFSLLTQAEDKARRDAEEERAHGRR